MRADVFKGEMIRTGGSRKRGDFEIFNSKVIDDTGLSVMSGKRDGYSGHTGRILLFQPRCLYMR